MNTLDVLLLVLIAGAAIGGYRLGFLTRVVSWIGLVVGLYLAVRLLPGLVDSLRSYDPVQRLMIAIGILVGAAFVGQAIGLLIGFRLNRTLPEGGARQLDRGAGAVLGLLGVLVAVWLMTPAMTDVPGWPARQARSSKVVKAIDDLFPAPPDTLESLGRLLGPGGFPDVFAGIDPSPSSGPPPAASGLTQEVAQRVAASTVKVEGIACDRRQEGSGFSVAPDVVVTNAHVVAGERQTSVTRLDGTRVRAVVAVFDPNRDLALLRAPGLGQDPLPVGDGAEGTVGAVFGHPNGQDDLEISPALVRQQVTALGRDIYDSRETRRNVFILASELQPGDSGGGFIDANGAVVGVAFAIAPDRPGTAYALSNEELNAILALPRDGRADTGPCISSV